MMKFYVRKVNPFTKHLPVFGDFRLTNFSGAVDTKWGPIKIGLYARYLERWLQYFTLSQFLFISGERLIVDPA